MYDPCLWIHWQLVLKVTHQSEMNKYNSWWWKRMSAYEKRFKNSEKCHQPSQCVPLCHHPFLFLVISKKAHLEKFTFVTSRSSCSCVKGHYSSGKMIPSEMTGCCPCFFTKFWSKNDQMWHIHMCSLWCLGAEGAAHIYMLCFECVKNGLSDTNVTANR